MSFNKSIILFTAMALLMTGLNGQEREPMDDESEESVEVSEEVMTTEVLSDKVMESSTEPIITEDSEVKAEPMTELSEEVDSTVKTYTPTTLQLSTESEEYLTTQYNGVDHKSSDSLGDEFSCHKRSFGQYADIASECHRFHLCYPFFNVSTDELMYQRVTFECDDNSVFDQKRFICVDNSTVGHKCSDSVDMYEKTNQEYVIRVFSHDSPQEEAKDHLAGSEAKQPNRGRGWFNWLYRG